MSGVEPLMLAGMAVDTLGTLQQQKSAKRQADQVYQNSLAAMETKRAADERRRTQELKQVSARQRARFAAQGLGTTDGSASAVLDGLLSRSAADAREREQLRDIERRRLAQNSERGLGGNLLEGNTKLVKDNLNTLLQWD